MSTTILIKADDLTRNTILGGNIDVDRYLSSIKACQNTFIKPLLGADLYNKVCSDFESSSLIGEYLVLYEDFVKELVIHGSAEIYLTNGAYMITNNGITKAKSDTAETVSKEEIDYLVQSSKKLYQLYEREFYKWIKTVTIAEWVVKGSRRVNIGGWSLYKRNINETI